MLNLLGDSKLYFMIFVAISDMGRLDALQEQAHLTQQIEVQSLAPVVGVDGTIFVAMGCFLL